MLQFVFEEYREEASELDIRVRQTKTNFGPKIDPIGMRFTFGDKNVSMGGYQLPDEELIEEESRPVKERIIAALKLEGHPKARYVTSSSSSVTTASSKMMGRSRQPTTYCHHHRGIRGCPVMMTIAI